MPKKPSALDVQVGGSHYKNGGIQHVQFCQVNRIPWCESAFLKYIIRHRKKNKAQDLEKAMHYVQLLIKVDYIDRSIVDEEVEDLDPNDFSIPLEKFLEDNPVTGAEREIIEVVLCHQCWKGESDLDFAVQQLQGLISNYEKTYEVDDPMLA